MGGGENKMPVTRTEGGRGGGATGKDTRSVGDCVAFRHAGISSSLQRMGMACRYTRDRASNDGPPESGEGGGGESIGEYGRERSRVKE